MALRRQASKLKFWATILTEGVTRICRFPFPVTNIFDGRYFGDSSPQRAFRILFHSLNSRLVVCRRVAAVSASPCAKLPFTLKFCIVRFIFSALCCHLLVVDLPVRISSRLSRWMRWRWKIVRYKYDLQCDSMRNEMIYCKMVMKGIFRQNGYRISTIN